MLRRLHVPRLFIGDVPLDPVQARHARDVLRLAEGTVVEVFDGEGNVARGPVNWKADGFVTVGEVSAASKDSVRIVVASAIPKGERADWMVEKLSELGVASFIPLAAERSVTVPQGRSKFERWARIATESAKQSRRAGVMSIEAVTPVDQLLRGRKGWVLSTTPGAQPLFEAIGDDVAEVLLVIGPEGGWTERELAEFDAAGFSQVALTPTVLRTETAAVAAAAVVAVKCSGRKKVAETQE